MKTKQKKILLSAVSITLAAALVLGIWFGVSHSRKDPVIVIPFEQVGMTEYWGDKMESHGPVSSDNIQTVYLSDTQTVTEVLVKEGDQVKKGDPMMTFDTTLSSLDVERKRLEVEKLKLDLIDEQDRLKQILGMRPMQTPPPMPEPGAPDLGEELTKPYRISGKPGFDGSSAEAPLIVWLRDDTEVDERLIEEILEYAMNMRVTGGGHSSPSADGNSPEVPGETPLETPEETPQPEENLPVLGPESGNSSDNTVTPDISPNPEPENPGTEEGNPQGDNIEGNGGESPVPDKPHVIQPSSKNDPVIAVATAQKLKFYSAPSLNSAVIAEKQCYQAAVKIYEQLEAEGLKWAFVELGLGDTAIEGWVPMEGSLEVEEEKPVPPDPPVPVDPVEPTDPDTNEIVKVTIAFDVTPRDAKVTLRRNDGTSMGTGNGSAVFQVEPGNYLYSVECDGYKSVYEQKLAVPADSSKTVVTVTLEPNQDLSKLNSVYVVFKTTEENRQKGARNLWVGMKLYQKYAFGFFDASLIPDYTMAADLSGEDDAQMPEFDMGSGMTAGQIAELRQEQEKKIEETKLKVKMAEADYKIKKRELEDGNIYAEFDGKVVSLLEEEESRKSKKPMIKVSGGGGYQVEGSVNELDREKMKIGQKVTVNDWNSGEMLEGEIIAIGEFPVRTRGYSGQGNPNSSYYPFTVFVDGEANLQTGSYVNIQYSAGENENGIYLENPFIREEKGKTYVYVLGQKNRLEKRFVTTGKALWGSYTEITSGLSEEDHLAFPYGKNVKSGAKAEIGDMGDLYR